MKEYLLQIQDGETEAKVFARKKQDKNMLDLKLSFILNDVMMNECEPKYLLKTNMVQSKLFITSLVITEYSISDIKLLGTDLFQLKFPLYNRIFT